ncbi:hypothetical protein ACS0TY_029499 [Phlomoides rotata]
MLFEVEQECLDEYKRKVDQANRSRAQLRQAVADAEAQLADICVALGNSPVHINKNTELYNRAFADEGDRMRFLRSRIQFLERRSIRKLDFGAGGINTIFQVFINVTWWYLAFYKMISPFLTQRIKSKFVFAGPTRSAETLFKYIVPEQVPTQYSGLSVDFCECSLEFTIDDPVTEITVKPATKQSVEIILNEVSYITFLQSCIISERLIVSFLSWYLLIDRNAHSFGSFVWWDEK